MDQEILQKFEEQGKKLDAIYVSVEKTRKYFLWTLIISIATVVLPIIGIIVLIPWFLKIMTSTYGGLL
jgi:type IV secretory pathway component VirB8